MAGRLRRAPVTSVTGFHTPACCRPAQVAVAYAPYFFHPKLLSVERPSSRCPTGERFSMIPSRWVSQSSCFSKPGTTGFGELMPWRVAFHFSTSSDSYLFHSFESCPLPAFERRSKGDRVVRQSGLMHPLIPLVLG